VNHGDNYFQNGEGILLDGAYKNPSQGRLMMFCVMITPSTVVLDHPLVTLIASSNLVLWCRASFFFTFPHSHISCTLPRKMKMGMQILVSPTGFKESLEPHVAADCIEAGILRVVPDANVRKVPLVDGGEGFARALVAAKGGECRSCSVTGPVNQPVLSHYGFLRGKSGQTTAVIEMAAVAGLRLVPKGMRDPTATTTYGVGELMVAALDEGAEHIIIGCGDSGTSDGGVGMCQALGARFLDRDGEELPLASGGRTLTDLIDIDLSHIHPRLRDVTIDALCNWKNVLCGKNGVARVYGPQKGATPEQVQRPPPHSIPMPQLSSAKLESTWPVCLVAALLVDWVPA
jgi:hypothetical protein